MANPPYSPIIFIGREKEVKLFERMLDNQEAQWILNLYGEGGMGKTQLLRRFAEIAKQHRNTLVTADLIDFYWTAHQRELGILKSIADQLAPKQFGPFYTTLHKYQQLLDQAEPPDPIYLHDQSMKARSQFIEVYKELAADRIVLLFDTAEVASETAIRFWQELLPILSRSQ
ncbi:MAG: ATP-binding protein [Thermoflexales bacterium]|nr:ATP-binding protein [Thermoflexales bacterium]